MKQNLLLITLILALVGCSNLSDKSAEVVFYYNLDSLLDKQHDLLKGAQLDKWAFVDGDTASTLYVPDSAQWKDELAFFNRMNINKAVLQDLYSAEVVDDTRSNLKVKQFTPANNSLEVKYLKIYYLKNIENLKKIEALYEEDNPIYKSSRQFTMEFDDVMGKVTLRNFIVKGGQKMILKDSVLFKVSAQVKKP